MSTKERVFVDLNIKKLKYTIAHHYHSQKLLLFINEPCKKIIPVFLSPRLHYIPMTRNQSIKIPLTNNFNIPFHQPIINPLIQWRYVLSFENTCQITKLWIQLFGENIFINNPVQNPLAGSSPDCEYCSLAGKFSAKSAVKSVFEGT